VNVPVTPTFVAGEGPLFVTVMVKVRFTPTPAGLGEAETVIARSAEATTVTLAMAVLFEGKGSASSAETLAVLVKLPAAMALATIESVALAPFAKLPKLQLTAVVQVPWLGIAETTAKPAGSVSVKVIPVAVEGPLLVTVNEKVTLLPKFTVCGAAVSARERSAAGFTVALALAELFAVLGSASVAVTFAEFVNVPAAFGLTTTITVALAPLAKLPSAQVVNGFVQVPWLGVVPINVAFAGSVSVRTTLVAGEGPLFVVVKV
jgi:hypothetical protein